MCVQSFSPSLEGYREYWHGPCERMMRKYLTTAVALIVCLQGVFDPWALFLRSRP